MAKRKLSAWQKHVKAYMATHKGLSFKEALPKAKLTYHHSGGNPGPRARTVKAPRKVKRKMAKKKRRRTSRTIPLAPVIGLIGTVATAKHPWAASGDTMIHKVFDGNLEGAVNDIPGAFLGIADDGLHWDTLVHTWSPLFVGFGIHWIAGLMGINRVLGRAKIPLIRV